MIEVLREGSGVPLPPARSEKLPQSVYTKLKSIKEESPISVENSNISAVFRNEQTRNRLSHSQSGGSSRFTRKAKRFSESQEKRNSTLEKPAKKEPLEIVEKSYEESGRVDSIKLSDIERELANE